MSDDLFDPMLDTLATPEEATLVAMEGMRAALWTALPGTVAAVRREGGACLVDVRPGVQARLAPRGEAPRWADLPLLPALPVLWQGGGGATFTFPVAPGDECLVVFACRDTAGWFAQGGAAPAPSRRMHDLSDGFAIVGLRSRPRGLPDLSATEAQLRADDGASLIGLTPGTGAVRIVAPGGVAITGGALTHNGVNIGATHRHGGVQPGGSNTGVPT